MSWAPGPVRTYTCPPFAGVLCPRPGKGASVIRAVLQDKEAPRGPEEPVTCSLPVLLWPRGAEEGDLCRRFSSEPGHQQA